jgi:hypothetical protein
MGWKKSAPCGASDLAKIRAGFLHKAERLLHGAQIAKNLENSDKWYQMPQASWPVVERSDTTGLQTPIRRIPEGMPERARVCL